MMDYASWDSRRKPTPKSNKWHQRWLCPETDHSRRYGIVFISAMTSDATPPPPHLATVNGERSLGPESIGNTGRQRKSPRREVVRSSAQAGVVYPPFWGVMGRAVHGLSGDV